LPRGRNTVEECHVVARKYPKAQQSRTGDKALGSQDSTTGRPRRCLGRGTMIALCLTIFAESLVPHFRDDIKVGYVSMKFWRVKGLLLPRKKSKKIEFDPLRPAKIALVLVRFNHVASFIGRVA
jgi:hypothetical protein